MQIYAIFLNIFKRGKTNFFRTPTKNLTTLFSTKPTLLYRMALFPEFYEVPSSRYAWETHTEKDTRTFVL